MKIKILRVITRLNIGGPAIHTILLTEALSRESFESLLVAGAVDKNEGDMMYLAKEKQLNPIIIPELCRKINLKNDLIALFKLYRIIRKEKPYIIHTHTAKAGTLGRVAAILARTPIKIHTFHGHVLHSYFGKIKTKAFLWIEKILAYFTDKIIVVSEKIKQDLLNLRISDSGRIEVIKLGLEIDKLLSVPVNSRSELKVGIIGRFVPIKNQKMFFDAAKHILSISDFNRNGLKFIVVGDGELEANLKDYVAQLKIENNVVFMGWQKNLEKTYADLDIVALTSLNEGTPVSLIEAMAAARAVVATDVGGVRDLLGVKKQKILDRDSSFDITERGVLVKSRDTKGFSSALKFLLKNSDTRLRMGRLGRDFAREHFHKSRLIQDIEDLYSGLIKEKS